ncbi:MAG: SymE family type I addiction module toxin [Bacteroidota bacterium]
MRKIKIQEFVIPARYPNNKLKVKPVLKLQGDWLQELGFSPGDYVNIVASGGRLIIERAEVLKQEVKTSNS